MGAFSKLWGSIGGSVIGVLFGLAVNFGLGTCTDVANVETCTVAGFSAGQVYAASLALFGALGTFFAPKNTPA